jgi:hypothetical protein
MNRELPRAGTGGSIMAATDERANQKAALTAAWKMFRRELPRLLEEGEQGRYALVTADQIVGVLNTYVGALGAGAERFGPDQPYIAIRIDPRFLQLSEDTPISFPRQLTDEPTQP